ncbi:MAG TPA: Gfo/Idh/MocA family oxidoreductase [Dehalococcoidia bacterium]|nr:Gfo/Idh/MocA family oxidoreductase [Dehalococcoidia bacterium]
MADKIRVGIVGATVTQGGSGWGANAHVPAINALPDFELKAVCTAHEDTAKASAAKFGAQLAFHDIDAMAAHSEVDLITVCVKVPGHRDLVLAGLRAGKPVFSEWPLGANTAEAEEMASLARQKGVRSLVGLQGRVDPAINYLRDLVAEGYVGEVLSTSMTIINNHQIERGSGRVWQADKAMGANTMTIQGGHTIDLFCHIVGEFAEVASKVETRVKQWRNTDTNSMVDVTSPDNIAVAGTLRSGAVASVYVAAVPMGGSGWRLEIYGTDGVIHASGAGGAHFGPKTIRGAKKGEQIAELPVPAKYTVVPAGTPEGPPANVAALYTAYAAAVRAGAEAHPNFDDAVQRHKLIDAIVSASEAGKTVRL